MLGNDQEILDSKFEDYTVLVFEQTKKIRKTWVRAHKKGPSPKIKILKSGSVFWSPRERSYIPNFMILRSQTEKMAIYSNANKCRPVYQLVTRNGIYSGR